MDRYVETLVRLRGRLWLTHAGLWAERITHAFWPLWSVLFVVLGILMLGLHDFVPLEALWTGFVVAAFGGLVALIFGIRRFSVPRRTEAIARLDDRLTGRPLQTLRDDQVIGSQDAASRAVWEAHQTRMAARADTAQAVAPDLRLSRRDPYALRYVAALLLAVALIFGSVWRVGTLEDAARGGALSTAAGPTWEGWVEPPAYTGLPTLYLADQPDAFEIMEGARITLRLYGEVGALTVAETVSGRTGDIPPASEPAQSFDVARSGAVTIDGPGGRSFEIGVTLDAAPEVFQAEGFEVSAMGEMSLPFRATDDYGIAGGEAVIALDLAAIDRRYGLARDPEPRDAFSVPLPLPLAGNRADFVETLVENFSEHPWSNLPVTITLTVTDELAQASAPRELKMALPGRRFFDPLAASMIEQRRALLWTRDNAKDVAQVLRAVTYLPDDIFRSATAYLRFRTILRRLETFASYDMTTEQRDEIAQALWDLAILLEDGDLADALERLQRAQDRLNQAMRNSASDQEIAELMQELREATNDYIRQLSQQAQREMEQNGEPGQQNQGEQMEMTQNDLQEMMNRIQELMEEGRMAEAQEALRQLQELMENMQVTQGQQGQGQQSPGEQAMEGLAETLRDQQGLSDDAFRDLQEQFNPNAQSGESQQNQGRDGGQGQGQQHSQQQGQGEGEPPEGQQGQGGAQDQAQGQQGQSGAPSLEENLADRQQELRRELERQRGTLPNMGGEAGEAARDALEQAERSMQGAEDALRQDNLPEAIDRQADAMEALREGMRNLGEAMAQEQQGQGEQGNQQSAGNPTQNDPLGRTPGSQGNLSSEERLLQGDDVYRRARDLLDEIRRRSGETERPEIERDYLERLLDRF